MDTVLITLTSICNIFLILKTRCIIFLKKKDNRFLSEQWLGNHKGDFHKHLLINTCISFEINLALKYQFLMENLKITINPGFNN